MQRQSALLVRARTGVGGADPDKPPAASYDAGEGRSRAHIRHTPDGDVCDVTGTDS